MNNFSKIIYLTNLLLLSLLIFLNIQESIPNFSSSTVTVRALSKSNEDSKGKEVWIANLEDKLLNSNLIKKQNWINKYGMIYADGSTDNKLIITSQKSLEFLSHPWSGSVEVIDSNNDITVLDLYSSDSSRKTIELPYQKPSSLNIVNFLTVALIFLLSNFLINILARIKIKINVPFNKIENKWVYLSVASFGTLILSIYLFAFWPGLISPDSISQWDQLSSFKFTDAHPAFHTLIYWLITRIYYSPASISIFQIISLVLIWLYGIKSILSNFKVSSLGKIIILITSAAFFALPPVGLMSVTLWKDVLFSYSLLLLTICLFNIAFDNSWINKKSNQSLLIITLVCTALIRHNGIITYLSIVFVLIYLYRNKVFKTILISILIILIVKYPFYKILKINKFEESSVSSGYALNYLNAYVYNKPALKEKYNEFYSQLYPDKKALVFYDSFCGNYSLMGLNYLFFNDQKDTIEKYLKEEIANDPLFITNEIKKRSSLIWQVKQPTSTYTYTHAIDDYKTRDVMKKKYNINFFNPNSKLSFFIRKIVYLTESEKYKNLFWRPALNLIIVLFISLYTLKKYKRGNSVILIIPIMTVSLGLFLTIPGQDYRYIYANLLISFYSAIILFGNKKTKKSP